MISFSSPNAIGASPMAKSPTAADLAAAVAADPRARAALERARNAGDMDSLARSSRAIERSINARKKQLPRTPAQRRTMSDAQRMAARSHYAATANAMAVICETLAEEYRTDIYSIIRDLRCRKRSLFILQLRRRFVLECRLVNISLPHIGRFIHRTHSAVLHIESDSPMEGEACRALSTQ